MTQHELILYATPVGPFAEACDRYFEAAAALGSTDAQRFPPHCTLTGFFHRSPTRAAEAIGELSGLLDETGPVPAGAVEVRQLSAGPDWVGLELSSPWLVELTGRLVQAHRLEHGEDPLRPKDWLHLSLAYGADDLRAHADLAVELVDPALPADWEVAVWERSSEGEWTRRA